MPARPKTMLASACCPRCCCMLLARPPAGSLHVRDVRMRTSLRACICPKGVRTFPRSDPKCRHHDSTKSLYTLSNKAATDRLYTPAPGLQSCLAIESNEELANRCFSAHILTTANEGPGPCATRRQTTEPCFQSGGRAGKRLLAGACSRRASASSSCKAGGSPAATNSAAGGS